MTPTLRVVRGNPCPDELAAIVVVLAAAHRRREPAPRGPGRVWGAPETDLVCRAPQPVARLGRPGTGTWRLSGLAR